MRQQKLARHRVARADDELAHLQGARLRELFLARFQKAHRAADVLEEHLPVVRERHAAWGADEQPRL